MWSPAHTRARIETNMIFPHLFDVSGWRELARREGVDLRPWMALALLLSVTIIGAILWLP